MDKSGLSQKAYLLHLSSVSLAEGMRSGSFRSLYRGRGIDFSGVREYLDGDDVRAIDWNVTARMGKPYVKLYDEEKEMDVLLLVDTSLSMASGAGRRTRLETALECASLLTLASFQNASPVGAVLFDGAIHFACAPKAGRDQMMLLLSAFDRTPARPETGSVLDSALQGADRLLKKRTLVMVFSDFRTSSWVEPFARLCHRHDVVAVRIQDALDESLPSVGSIPFADPESGWRMVLPTSSSKFRRQWGEAHLHHADSWRHECIRHGGVPLVVGTDGEPLVELTKFFARRER